MMILVALVLVGLTGARKRADDDNRVSRLRTVALALEQYRDVCRVYPTELNKDETCDALEPKTLSVFIPEIETFDFNATSSSFFGGNESPFKYAPTASFGTTEPCIGYHLGVQLRTDGSFERERANFQIGDDDNLDLCGIGSVDFDPGERGDAKYYFDVHR